MFRRGGRAVDTLVIVPTYNECENIGPLLDQLLDLPLGLEILVVDDQSPDGTGDVVRTKMASDTRVHLMQRPRKMGLGSAYVAGFRYALENGAHYVIQMDADFSHDPASVPEFLRNAQAADVVLGSRYLRGVSVVNWPLRRLLLSYWANQYTRVITGLPTTDATSGFKCISRRAIEAVRLDSVRSDGYAFQIEFSFKCWKRGLTIRDIPIIFVERRSGTSKISRRIIWEAAWIAWKLRLLSLVGRAG
jgi:dolichol-phosphate mannosyltransferase